MQDSFPEKLHVYECRGPRPPRREPAGDGCLGVWSEAPFYYVFYDRPAQPMVLKWLQDNGNGWSLTNTYQMDYRQWQQVASSDYRVGPFSIQTTFDSDATGSGEEAIPILLNPSVVFGTGLHQTTRCCLLAIAELFSSHSIESAVDLGTGTGILALACAKLGASRVLAVDCIPLAAQVTRKNILANNEEHTIAVLAARDLTIFKRPADLLLMNLEWPCLRRVILERRWLDYRWVVMSGFLRPQMQEVEGLLGDAATIAACNHLEDWTTLLVEPKSLEA